MTEAAVEWSYNPWRDRPARAAFSLLAGALCALLVSTAGLPALPSVALGAAVLGSFGIALVPVRCRLDEAGVTRRSAWFAERRPWTSVVRAVRTPGGLLLSPYARRHWLEAYRGLVLPLPPGESRARVEEILVSHGL